MSRNDENCVNRIPNASAVRQYDQSLDIDANIAPTPSIAPRKIPRLCAPANKLQPCPPPFLISLREEKSMLTKAKDLTGYALEGKDGEIGKVKDFYFDDRHWAVRYLVAETGTWLTERKVLLSPYSLLKVDTDKKRVVVELTKKQIEDSPALSTDKPVSAQFEASYYNYYGWPIYWQGSYAWGNYPMIVREPRKRDEPDTVGKEWDPHLRSANEVRGYHIQAQDGEIGHVYDYVIDDETWAIAYLVVDTKNWLPGRTVLISPKWIESVNWEDARVRINLTRDAIKRSPEYSEKVLLDRVYEEKLHGHYSREGYWVR